ncbi:MAG TPA: arginine deiminase-related protein [Flavisolibacter sp.]|nr:arginine deiminase-related protein [Flavisolibacter sp.]
MQTADTILMVRPAAFVFNEQTAANNYFQQQTDGPVHDKALQEFDAMVATLRGKGIQVMVIEDTPEPIKPDAIFPNNWFCTSTSGFLNIFPMFAPNRREEKRDEILQHLSQTYEIQEVYDWTEFEAEDMYLEGTGSMVIDHVLKIVYACLSPRTHPSLVQKFAKINGYQAITFTAKDDNGQLIYHTNVMLSIGDGYAVLCADAIEDDAERIAVIQLLASTGRDVVPITLQQMKAFAGNMLQVRNQKEASFIVMSRTAFDSLEAYQKEALERFGALLPIDVTTIETVNGGSVRCMMAEIFLQPKSTVPASLH